MKGFTLIELAVVLLVLAVTAHLAVRELGKFRDSKLSAAADRQLAEIRDAVWTIGADGDPAGFLADMGRLPRVAQDGRLAELWRIPAAARRFAALPATADNICIADDTLRNALADENVFVPTGWRGPYLRLPLGRDELLDPWGNPVAAMPPGSTLPTRVWADAALFATNVAHYGASAQAHDRRDMSLVPDGGATASLTIYTEIVGESAFSGDITYRWWGPADGLVTGAVETVAYPAPVRFEGLAPGVRIIKDSASKIARRIVVRPGDNTIQLKIVK